MPLCGKKAEGLIRREHIDGCRGGGAGEIETGEGILRYRLPVVK